MLIKDLLPTQVPFKFYLKKPQHTINRVAWRRVGRGRKPYYYRIKKWHQKTTSNYQFRKSNKSSPQIVYSFLTL